MASSENLLCPFCGAYDTAFETGAGETAVFRCQICERTFSSPKKID